MLQPRRSPPPSLLGFLVLLVVLVGGGAATFAYTAGWLSPERLTPVRMVDAFKPAGGVPLGHRKNHAKGICFTGVFEANGAGSALSGPRSSPPASIRLSGASISAPPIRTRPMRPFACGAWDCGFRRRTGRSGAPP